MTIGFAGDGPAEPEDDTREAEPLQLADGECHISDGPELYELTDSLASQFRDGQLYVLKRDTLKWVSVEDINNKPAGKLSAIRGGNGTK
jgi:hypothetical protein